MDSLQLNASQLLQHLYMDVLKENHVDTWMVEGDNVLLTNTPTVAQINTGS